MCVKGKLLVGSDSFDLGCIGSLTGLRSDCDLFDCAFMIFGAHDLGWAYMILLSVLLVPGKVLGQAYSLFPATYC